MVKSCDRSVPGRRGGLLGPTCTAAAAAATTADADAEERRRPAPATGRMPSPSVGVANSPTEQSDCQPACAKKPAGPSAITWANPTDGALTTVNCNFVPTALVVYAIDPHGKTVSLATDNIGPLQDILLNRPVWEDVVRQSRQPLPPKTKAPSIDDDDQVFELDACEDVSSSVSNQSSAISSPFIRDHSSSVKALGVPSSQASSIAPHAKSRKRAKLANGRRSQARTVDEEDSDDGNDEDSIPTFPARSFEVSNAQAIEQCLKDLLEQLQQLSCKIILKEWIRLIEPKKQAKYPYISSNPAKRAWKRNKEGKRSRRTIDERENRVPDWWPIEKCRHVEPDHILKRERIELAIHLLRLRRKTPWVKMLKSVTQDKKFEFPDADREWTEKRAERRRRILNTIYEVAQHEEDLFDDAIDANMIISIPEFPLIGGRTKRTRQTQKTGEQMQIEFKNITPPSPQSSSRMVELMTPTSQLNLQEMTTAATFQQMNVNSSFTPPPVPPASRNVSFSSNHQRASMEPMRFENTGPSYMSPYHRPRETLPRSFTAPSLTDFRNQYPFGRAMSVDEGPPPQLGRMQAHGSFDEWHSSTQRMTPHMIPTFQSICSPLTDTDYVYPTSMAAPGAMMFTSSEPQMQMGMACVGPECTIPAATGLGIMPRRQMLDQSYEIPDYRQDASGLPHGLPSVYDYRANDLDSFPMN